MAEKIRFGIVGTNFVSDWFAEAAKESGVAEVVAVCSRTSEGAQAFAKKHGILHTFSDYQAFLQSEYIDAVYVATPNCTHKDYSLKALCAGKHVFCEKPAALCSMDLEEVQSCAKANGKLFLEAMRPYFDPVFAQVRAALSRVGTLRYGRLEFCQYSSRYDAFKAGEILRAFDPAYGNAAVLDIGIYPLSVVAMLFGAPQTVQSKSLFLKNGFEAMGSATLGYENMLVDVVYSKITQSQTPSVLVGENGTLTVDAMSKPAEIFFIANDGKKEKMPCTPSKNNMVWEIKAFCEAVKEGKTEHQAMVYTRIATALAESIIRQNGILWIKCYFLRTILSNSSAILWVRFWRVN